MREYAHADLTGRTFGRLTAEAYVRYPPKPDCFAWLCRCACGRTVIVRTYDLLHDRTRACRHCGSVRQPTFIDLTGRRVNALTMIERVPSPHRKKPHWWLCRCDCGRTCHVHTTELIHGRRRSCGCENRSRHADEIITMWEGEGGPMSRIAGRFNVSKGTVAGVLHRVGLIGPQPTPPRAIELPPFGQCMWTDDDPGDPSLTWCGLKVHRGSAWCEEHHHRVYLKPPEVRIEPAVVDHLRAPRPSRFAAR